MVRLRTWIRVPPRRMAAAFPTYWPGYRHCGLRRNENSRSHSRGGFLAPKTSGRIALCSAPQQGAYVFYSNASVRGPYVFPHRTQLTKGPRQATSLAWCKIRKKQLWNLKCGFGRSRLRKTEWEAAFAVSGCRSGRKRFLKLQPWQKAQRSRRWRASKSWPQRPDEESVAKSSAILISVRPWGPVEPFCDAAGISIALGDLSHCRSVAALLRNSLGGFSRLFPRTGSGEHPRPAQFA